MSQVFHNSENSKKSNIVQIQSPLEKLKADLLNKRESSVEKGLVQDIQMIDKALNQLDTAINEASLNQKITNSQARLGQIRPATKKIAPTETTDLPKVIGEREASYIREIKSVKGKSIQSGEQFASMYGKEPSNITYMRDNIDGLFDLLALKE